MRPCHREQFRTMLLLIGFPQESVAIKDSPFAGRLLALDVEMQMRPTATRTFFAEYANFLSHLDPIARADRRFDGFEMRVTIIPASQIEHVNVVVISLRLVIGRLGKLRKRLATR